MKLSVILATRNRAHAIAPCLDSIAAAFARAAPLDAEIVVVDNGSTDDTAAIIEAWARAHSVSVQRVFEPRAGKARAINRALQCARGDVLAFTDDDCRLDSEYVNDLLRHDARDTGLVLRGGRVELGDPADLPITIKTSAASTRWSKQTHYAKNANLFDGKFGCNIVIGCNMATRTAVIERVGLFDERFGPGTSLPGAEDTDYILRAYLGGVTMEYVPDMVTFHHHGRKSVSDGHRLMTNYMIATGGLYAKYLFSYPNLSRPFYWDTRKALQEIRTGQRTFMPEIGFSHKKRVMFCVAGALNYWIACCRG